MTERTAYWVDLDEPYVTLDNTYVESTWWAMKRMFDQGMLYRGHKVLPYCPQTGTSYSSHEVALGYKEVEEPSVYVSSASWMTRLLFSHGRPRRGRFPATSAWPSGRRSPTSAFASRRTPRRGKAPVAPPSVRN